MDFRSEPMEMMMLKAADKPHEAVIFGNFYLRTQALSLASAPFP